MLVGIATNPEAPSTKPRAANCTNNRRVSTTAFRRTPLRQTNGKPTNKRSHMRNALRKSAWAIAASRRCFKMHPFTVRQLAFLIFKPDGALSSITGPLPCATAGPLARPQANSHSRSATLNSSSTTGPSPGSRPDPRPHSQTDQNPRLDDVLRPRSQTETFRVRNGVGVCAKTRTLGRALKLIRARVQMPTRSNTRKRARHRMQGMIVFRVQGRARFPEPKMTHSEASTINPLP